MTEAKHIIRDPIHGYVRVFEHEVRLIDTPVFQRLRNIKQSGAASFVYPGAQHTRFEHSLGTMHVASRICQMILGETHEQILALRIAALLHDIGQGPYSHVFEQLLQEKRKISYDMLRQRVISETEIGDVIGSYGYSTDDILDIFVGGSESSRLLTSILSAPVDADKIDYLLRDAYYTGIQSGNFDASGLIGSFRLLRNRVVHKLDSIDAIESFLLARYHMFNTVYFHRAVRAVEIMLLEAMRSADDEMGLTAFDDIDDYLMMNDSFILTHLTELKLESERSRRALMFIRMLNRMNLIRVAFEKDLKTSLVVDPLESKRFIGNLKQEISSKAKIEQDEVFIDVPIYKPREADIHVCDVDKIERFSEKSEIARLLLPVFFIRVYTLPSYLSRVRRAATKVFSRLRAIADSYG